VRGKHNIVRYYSALSNWTVRRLRHVVDVVEVIHTSLVIGVSETLQGPMTNACTARLAFTNDKGKVSPYSIAERRVPELIPVLGSQPAGDVSHKSGGRLPLFSARPAVTLATLKRAATNYAVC